MLIPSTRVVKSILALLVVSMLLACNFSLGASDGPTAAPTSLASPTQPHSASEKRCGDGVCDGPETVENCAQDCASDDPLPPTETASMPPLYIGLSVHLEGYPLGNSATGYNEAVYTKYRQRILAYSDLANGYGMPLTWETANLIGPSATFEPNVLVELHQRGDGVGVHADLGGNPRLSGDEEKFTVEMETLRLKMEAMGIPVVHASGICSDMDWVTAARGAGYQATTGAVKYCLKSLPVDQQPSEVQACTSPGDGVCHDPYPEAFPEAMHPWWAADGDSWTTPAEDGLLIVPTLGTIHGLYESTHPDGPHVHNEMTQEDVDIALQLIEEALASRAPDQVNAFFFVWSFGQAIDHQLLSDLLQGIQPYVESGDVVWQTMPQMVDTIEAYESSPISSDS